MQDHQPPTALRTTPRIGLPGRRHQPSLRHQIGGIFRRINALVGRASLVGTAPIDRGPPPAVDPDTLRHVPADDTAAEDTFALYRIIGNELPPRHGEGQNLRNLEFLLEHEPEFPNCEKTWVLNRIVDSTMEQALIQRLDRAGCRWLRIPFDHDAYAEIGWDYAGLPSPDFLDSRAFRRLSVEQQASARLRVYRHKNNYVMNNNGARNFALADGRARAKWILPWDGNCFLNTTAWEHLRYAVRAYPGTRYIVVPMQRLTNNAQGLEISGPERAGEEPQVAFHRNSVETFDEAHPYGRWPKAELLCRLGVPGPWGYWARKPWDLPVPGYADEAGYFIEASWVMRLASGQAGREGARSGATRARSLTRAEGIRQFIDELDKSL